jgi:hypothetical protein
VLIWGALSVITLDHYTAELYLHDLTILLLGNAATVYALTQHRPAAVIATESGATSYQRPGAAPDNPTGV